MSGNASGGESRLKGKEKGRFSSVKRHMGVKKRLPCSKVIENSYWLIDRFC